MTMATWRGRRSGGKSGGRAPEGWGVGGRTGRLAEDAMAASLMWRPGVAAVVAAALA
jgi:hypothetical protein